MPAPTLGNPRLPALSHPSIVLILTDDLRADTLSCTGHPFVNTPRIDQIGAEGAIFQQAFVVTPLCCPSRATLLSGLHLNANGVSTNGLDFNIASSRLLPSLLREAGYATAFIGKYHLGFNGAPRPGWDHWISYEGKRGHGDYYDARLNVDGITVRTQGYSTDLFAQSAEDWIMSRNGPFFLVLSLKNPHYPLTPPRRHLSLYGDAQVDLPPGFEEPLENLPRAIQRMHEPRLARTWAAEDAEDESNLSVLWRRYARMVPSVDEAVGRVYDALARRELLDSTLLIFSSDNGILLGEHHLFRKSVAYDASVQVPLLARYPPAVEQGARLSEPVLNTDLAPTVLAVAGVDQPEEMIGRNFLQLTASQPTEWRQDWLMVGDYVPGSRPVMLAVRGAEWKYVRYLDGEVEEQLFHLQHDPHELHNLAGEVDMQERLEQLRARMITLMAAERIPAGWFDARPIEMESLDRPKPRSRGK